MLCNLNYEDSILASELVDNHDKRKKINQVKRIISMLTEGLVQNKANQISLLNQKEELSKKQILIEKLLDQIKKINKAKQKKHTKYLSYTPLNKIYYYCQKKIHCYYLLLDIVIKNRKKQKLPEKTQAVIVSNSKELNRYHFNKNEDQILKKTIFNSEMNNEIIDYEDLSRIVNRPPLHCYVRSLELSKFYKYKKWTSQEDNILKKAILYYGPINWQQISYCLEGRNNSQCFHRWMKGINPKIKRDKWSLDEDLTVGIAMKILGNKKWSKISYHLNGRTDIQCRERFCNILDPNLEDSEWNKQEDTKLILMYEKYGNKWSKIANSFGNRTDNMCWRRWKFLTSTISTQPNETPVHQNTIINKPTRKQIKRNKFDNSESNINSVSNNNFSQSNGNNSKKDSNITIEEISEISSQAEYKYKFPNPIHKKKIFNVSKPY